jgi:uncharacterized membrane protein YccC
VDHLVADRWLPYFLDERRRYADRQRVLNALAPPRRPLRPALVALGRGLRLLGQRLETAAAPSPAPRPLAIVADPCGGCAN